MNQPSNCPADLPNADYPVVRHPIQAIHNGSARAREEPESSDNPRHHPTPRGSACRRAADLTCANGSRQHHAAYYDSAISGLFNQRVRGSSRWRRTGLLREASYLRVALGDYLRRAGNDHVPSTTTNAVSSLLTAGSHVVRDPPSIETCAPAQRLLPDLGFRHLPEALQQPQQGRTRGFGPARFIRNRFRTDKLAAEEGDHRAHEGPTRVVVVAARMPERCPGRSAASRPAVSIVLPGWGSPLPQGGTGRPRRRASDMGDQRRGWRQAQFLIQQICVAF